MKDTYYMKHDINTSQDNAIVSMRVDYGTYGYGLFWLVNEYLRSQTGCKVKISEVKNIAFSLNEDFEKVNKFVDDCINTYSLYHSDGNYFWSDRMIVDKDHLDSIRQTYRDNGKKGGRPKAKHNQAVNQAVNQNKTNCKAKPNQTESNKGKVIKVSKGNDINKDKIIHTYHDHCKKLPKVSKISDKRKSAINSLLKEFSLEQIIEGIQKAGKSSFINGDNKSNWKASFDWIINKNNMLKIIEGNYDNKGKKCVADINAQNANWEGVPEL